MSRSAMGVWGVAALTLAHLVAVVVFQGDRDGLRLTHDLAGWASSLAGAAGTFLAAAAFARGDYLRRVWGFFAGGSFLLLLGTAIRSYWTHTAPFVDFAHSPVAWPRFVVVGGANLVSSCGLILLAYTYARSGLDAPRSARFTAVWIALSAVALFMAQRQVRIDLGRLGTSSGQTAVALTSILSTVGDTTTFVLIAPVLQIAYLMRGGRLASIWWAVGLSGTVWLLYDYREWISTWLPVAQDHALELVKVMRTPGLALVGLGGLLQREAVAGK